jgi:hypothetical protein
MRKRGALSLVAAASGCLWEPWRHIKVNQNCLNISDPDLAGRGQA